MPSTYFWRDETDRGLERLCVSIGSPIVAHSTVVNADGGFTYSATLSANWQFRSLSVTSGETEQTLALVRQDDGRWLKDGVAMPELEPAFDIDLEISPFTNTLPIRRLGLAVGQNAEITVAYVSFPSLDVTLERQRYTREDARHYLFESLDGDFRRIIEVDEDGFVSDYPGLFKLL